MITVASSLKEDCPNFSCTWENMINGGLATELVCGLSSEFEGSGTSIDLGIISGTISGNPKAIGDTFISPMNPSRIIIKINKDLCDLVSPVEALKLYSMNYFMQSHKEGYLQNTTLH